MNRGLRAAASFITAANLRAIGTNLQRLYPVERAGGFEDMLAAVARAERQSRWSH